MHRKSNLLLLLCAALLLLTLSACGDQEPTLTATLGGQSANVEGRATTVTKTSWLGETSTQEVAWTEDLADCALTMDGAELTLTFSAKPDSLQMQVSDGQGEPELWVFSPGAEQTFLVEAGCSYQVTGTWTVGSTVYEMEFAQILVS